MHELCSSLGGGLGDDGGPCGLHRLEGLPAALVKNADEIDDGLRPFRGAPDRIRIAKVCLDGVDLADAAERLQVKCKIGPAHGHANSPSALGERPYHMAADEAGTSVNRDELVDRRFGHDELNVLRITTPRERYAMAEAASSKAGSIDKREGPALPSARAQVAELVDALVSGTSGESRGGSSPLLGTRFLTASFLTAICHDRAIP